MMRKINHPIIFIILSRVPWNVCHPHGILYARLQVIYLLKRGIFVNPTLYALVLNLIA